LFLVVQFDGTVVVFTQLQNTTIHWNVVLQILQPRVGFFQ
jgi:hypothetical protein